MSELDRPLPPGWQPSPAFWAGRAVAVTGASGFLGAHLTEQLVSLGASVVALRRDEVPPTPLTSRWSQRVAVVSGDITDAAVLERMLAEYGTEVLFHLAAQSQVGVANAHPMLTFEVNARGTWSLLEAVRRTGSVRAVVIASSDKAYGDNGGRPYTEDLPLLGSNPYDLSKAFADRLASCYAGTYSLPVAVTRCANLFGPGDLNWRRLVPGTIRSLLRGERPVIRSDGSMVRDYLDVRDGGLAYLCLAEHLWQDTKLSGQAFNFSMERPLTVLEMVELLQRAAGTDLVPDIRNSASHEIPVQVLSSERAKRALGWTPSRDVEAALAETVSWYRGYLEDRGC